MSAAARERFNRLVLDTGASHSGVTAGVALALGLTTDQSPSVLMRGVTGAATVPTIQSNALSIPFRLLRGQLIVVEAISEPALLIGMDALGVLDTLIIDYGQHDLELRTQKIARGPGSGAGMAW